MIGVEFKKSVAPYGAGDKALVPEDVAQTLFDNGEADLCEFPGAPHAAAFVEAPAQKPMRPQLTLPGAKSRDGRQTYRTKGK